mmetsp:Transcript_14197/g.43996  ORF Transcript_14197/g.43996 Transcript_14197/m.43996 type:complete len:370 (-) Transcript_14197:172-1281(-)
MLLAADATDAASPHHRDANPLWPCGRSTWQPRTIHVAAAPRATRSQQVRTPLDEFEARPRDELRCVWTAIMFLTRLPCPGWCDHHPGYLMRSLAYFPLLGSCVVGLWAAAMYDAASSLWSPLIAAALSAGGTLWLTGCFHEDGLCDTLDGFGGGWTKSQILKIMRDSRNGSYATMAGGLWIVAKCAAIAALHREGGSTWAWGASAGAGPVILVAQGLARASSAPLVFFYDYVVDDEDAKGEYYNWFGESRRLLGPYRVLFAIASAICIAFAALHVTAALRALSVVGVGTIVAGEYGRGVLGGVMGDFLGATICMLEVGIYLAVGADVSRADAAALARCAVVVSLPQIYGRWRKWYERRHGYASPKAKEC